MQFYPPEREFIDKAKRGNLIPVYTELLADLETPVSAFLKIDRGEYSYLLESVEGGEKIARYSFLGSNPSLIFESRGRNISITRNGKKETYQIKEDPLSEIKRLMQGYRFVREKNLPRFCGGLVGYLGYDVVRFFEELPDKNPDELNLADVTLLMADTLLIFDHLDHKIKVVSNAFVENSPKKAYSQARGKIKALVRQLQSNPPVTLSGLSAYDSSMQDKDVNPQSNFSEKDFGSAVEKAKEYIRAGDIIQVVLSQRFKCPLESSPVNVYRALRSINPSPYMFYLKFKDFCLAGSSPEVMVRCEDERIELRPIAGTRPRGKDEKEDNMLMEDLLKDPKERAEHIMLVDLGRNDLGRVSVYGSVKLPELMVIEKYSHVMHIVSDCVGKLKKGMDAYDVIRATFPAGTVTGAPKIRAMEIIDELEKTRRGPYAGAVGYFSFSGNLDTCITIRTILIKGRNAYIQAGAGIVADSNPEREYQETLNKARGMLRALQLAGGKI